METIPTNYNRDRTIVMNEGEEYREFDEGDVSGSDSEDSSQTDESISNSVTHYSKVTLMNTKFHVFSH